MHPNCARSRYRETAGKTNVHRYIPGNAGSHLYGPVEAERHRTAPFLVGFVLIGLLRRVTLGADARL
jgi:hypothetical protein